VERRDALKIAGAVFAGVGTVYGVRRLQARSPGPIDSFRYMPETDYDFENHAMGMDSMERPVRPDDEPVIDVDAGAKEVVADGVHFYGSSECDTSEFGGFEYDEDDDRVKDVVQSRKSTRPILR